MVKSLPDNFLHQFHGLPFEANALMANDATLDLERFNVIVENFNASQVVMNIELLTRTKQLWDKRYP